MYDFLLFENKTSLVKIVKIALSSHAIGTVLNMILHHLGLLISFIHLSSLFCQSRPSEGLEPGTASAISGQSSWSSSLISLPGESDQGYSYCCYDNENDAGMKKISATQNWLKKSSSRRGGVSRYYDAGLISSIRDFFSFGFGSRKSCAPSTPCR